MNKINNHVMSVIEKTPSETKNKTLLFAEKCMLDLLTINSNNSEIPEISSLNLIKIQSVLDKNKNYSLDIELENSKKLTEQHRNTRHDSIEKMDEIRARWSENYNFTSAENMLNEITGAIMNLKQREPK